MLDSLLISLLLAAAVWFAVIEAPVLFGLYEPARALRRWLFSVTVSLVVLVFMMAVPDGGVSAGIADRYAMLHFDGMSLLIVSLSSFLSILLLRMLSFNGSVIYAVLGAFGACQLKMSGTFDSMDLVYLLSFVAAPVLAFVAAFFIGILIRSTFRRRNIHLIKLSHYMRIAVICVILISAAAVGVNFGEFLKGLSSIAAVSGGSAVAAVGIVLCLLLTFMLRNSENEGYYSDFTIYSVITVGLASALTIFFFSFGSSASLIGLAPVPLSLSSLVAASIGGASLGQKSQLVGKEIYVKETCSMILAPVLAFMTAYMMLYFSGNGEHVADFVVMTVAVTALLAVCFWGYARAQRRQHHVTEKLVASQQQQIYENSRALNDMEIKVVMSENQALHNAVEMKRQEVMNVALSIVEQKEYLEQLSQMVKRLSLSHNDSERTEIISEMDSSLRQRLSYERDVDSQYFYAQAESLHEDFNAKLAENHPGLTQQERRLATLLRLGFSSKYIATLMNITPKSVEISRYRLRQKLGLSKGDNLVNYIKSI